MASGDGITISKRGFKRFFIFLVTVAIIGGVAVLALEYQEQRRENARAQADIKRLSDPAEAAKDKENKLIEAVKKVAVVPNDERPTIARVDDPTKLNVPLVEKDDIVFLYPEARRQIIYRPSTNLVIVAVNLPEETPIPVPAEATEPAATPTQ